jgi:hypothetical protein
MTTSLYDLTVPVYDRRLNALIAILDKAEAHAAARGIDAPAMMTDRLYPDMFPFWLQVQSACDHAKNSVARLAGEEMPILDQTTQTFDGLKERIRATLAFTNSISTSQFDGAAERIIRLPQNGKEQEMTGLDYLLHSGLPNFYFHLTTAYGILRHNGVEIGKRDFLGNA